MNAKLNIGDKVELKSGSPEMTVVAVDEHESSKQVECMWYDYNKHEMKREYFPVAALNTENAR